MQSSKCCVRTRFAVSRTSPRAPEGSRKGRREVGGEEGGRERGRGEERLSEPPLHPWPMSTNLYPLCLLCRIWGLGLKSPRLCQDSSFQDHPISDPHPPLRMGRDAQLYSQPVQVFVYGLHCRTQVHHALIRMLLPRNPSTAVDTCWECVSFFQD